MGFRCKRKRTDTFINNRNMKTNFQEFYTRTSEMLISIMLV
jgi:hypothetical protein